MDINTCNNHRRSIRIRKYDYALRGKYFVTICTQNRTCLFGEIYDYKMKLSAIGQFARQCWLAIPNHHENVLLDGFVIMPNHVHGIIIIAEKTVFCPVGAEYLQPLQETNNAKFIGRQSIDENKFQHVIPHSLGTIIRGYKIGVTKLCKQNRLFFAWQRNYYEHVIRNEKSLTRIRRYIANNPFRWKTDRNNPVNIVNHQG